MSVIESTYFKKSFVKAAIVHGAILMLIVVSFQFTPKMVSSEPMSLTVDKQTPNIVQAITVNQTQVEQALQQLRSNDLQKKAAVQQLQNQAALAKQQQVDAQKQLQQLAKQKSNMIAQQLAETKKAQENLDALKKQQQAEAQAAQQQLAALKKQQDDAQKQLQKTQAEAKQHADAVKAQQEALAKQKAAQQAAAQKAAQAQMDAIHEQQVNSELSRYSSLITQAIEAQWTLLPGAKDKKLTTTMLIQLAPDGKVLSVKNLTSSGNDVLDRLALSAVYKASPLPVPTDPELFDKVKDLKVSFQDE